MGSRFSWLAAFFGVTSAVLAATTDNPLFAVLRVGVVIACALVIGGGLLRRSEAESPTRTQVLWPAALVVALTVPPMLFANDDRAAAWGQLLVAVVTLGLVALPGTSVLRERLLLAAGIAALFAYPNFGRGHFGSFVHTWDVFHRYVTAKYAPELGSDRLYACTVIADAEKGPLADGLLVTDLATGQKRAAADYLADPAGSCTSRFSKARWAAFTDDVDWFRKRMSAKRWTEIENDYGPGVSPAWVLVAMPLANVAPPVLVAVLDPLLLFAAAMFVLWAFGARAFAVSSLMLGSNWALGFFWWDGGSYLHHAWLACAVAAPCLLARERQRDAGVALALAALFSGYTVLLFAGPLLAWRRLQTFFTAAAVTALLMLGASSALLGPSAWVRFVSNPSIDVPKTNTLGLGTALAYSDAHRGQVLRDAAAPVPWLKWREQRLADLESTRALRWVLIAAACVLLGFALKRSGAEPWLAVSLSAGLIPLVMALSNFHYVLFMVLGLAASARREAGLVLCAMAAFGVVVTLSPLQVFSSWFDVQSVWLSWAAVLAVVATWSLFTFRGAKGLSRGLEEAIAPRVG